MKTIKLLKASYLIVIPMLVACDEAPVAEKGVDTTLEVTDQSAQNDVEELRSEKLGQSSFSDDLTQDMGIVKSKGPAGSRKTKAGNLPSISSEAYDDGSDEYEYYEEPPKIAQLPKRAKHQTSDEAHTQLMYEATGCIVGGKMCGSIRAQLLVIVHHLSTSIPRKNIYAPAPG